MYWVLLIYKWSETMKEYIPTCEMYYATKESQAHSCALQLGYENCVTLGNFKYEDSAYAATASVRRAILALAEGESKKGGKS